MIDANGRFYPNLSPKQIEVYNDNSRHMLLSGPRICGKTIIAVHKILKHAWLYDNDRIGIFARSTKIGKIGIWSDLIDYAIPEWCGIDSNGKKTGKGMDGFEVTVPPSIDGATRMHYLRVRNRHGGESEIQLHSLHFDDDVEAKLRGSRFGMQVFDEADNYESEEVFNISVMQLRQIGLPYEKHCWLGTCNPSPDGQDHWLYKKFYQDPYDETKDADYRKSFSLHEFKLKDNIYLTQQQLTTLKETYASDPSLYERYVNGLWVPDIKRSLFAGAFIEGQHVKGSAQEGTIIMPTDMCSQLLVGWDAGSVNHAVTFLEKVTTLNGEYYAVLDEISHIGQDVSLEALTIEVMAKMEELQSMCKNKIRFKHWSDRSALDSFRAASGAKDAAIIYSASKGQIELIACPKGPNSVAARIALVRQLLLQKKLYFSANCADLISCMKKISKGKHKSEPIKRDKRGDIHRFDSVSYALYGELIDQVHIGAVPQAQKFEPFSL